MKNILIIFFLFSVALSAQSGKVINTNPFTTASGDLQGTYPSPIIKNDIINRANLTQGLRDSIARKPKDTVVIRISNYDFEEQYPASLWARYNNVYVMFENRNGAANLFDLRIPSPKDSLVGTRFIVIPFIDAIDSINIGTTLGSNISQGIGGYSNYATKQIKSAKTSQLFPIVQMHCVRSTLHGGYTWLMELDFDLQKVEAIINAEAITSLVGDVTGTGTGALTTLISNLAVTTAKLNNLAVTTGKLANASVTLSKMANDAVNSAIVVDYSLTGSDLNYLSLRAGDGSNAILRFNSGTDKSSLSAGEWLFNGNRLAFAIGSTAKRIPLTNDVAPTAGQIPIGNGTDYTINTLTGGSNIAITNSSGAISIATYPKRDTLIYLNNIDYNLGTALTSAEVNRRYTKILVNSYLSSSASSDNQLTMPVPGANYELCEIQYYAYDESGDADDATITFGINLGVLGNGSYTSSYGLVTGQMVTIRCMKDTKDSNNYKWFFW